ncbi:molybdopterin-dependent oxidoreductase [Spongiibacter nanhainus]|uniref:Molybdopterin-dependent oxidoreductase n=1 Tax=Spongiibacter nanhainus TaxID=2794344 RepID=A0A7T4USK5_9GAMM|nr:molybdopterin-dependent oxidoreductase [Spongiibacter nanhainus]QQD19505.1 molybdopterin-dependent oxidoreductase [Spongiibacter nanhainus]
MREQKSYCRLCFGFCGVNVTIDDNERVVSVVGDHDNPATQGYACVKGLELPSALYGDRRLWRPLKKVDDRHEEIDLEQALDEIAQCMQGIIDQDSAQSLAFYRGTGTFGSNVAALAFPALADAVGGQRFSTMTIDQSAKWVTADRLGTWHAGKQAFEDADVWLFAGANPLVSVFSWHTPVQNPMKRLKEAKAQGLKLIVIDPRECEMAKFADIHLQIYPGEDAAVAAGLIHLVLNHNWHDAEFCAQHVEGLEQLREQVAPFTPELVAARAGIGREDLIAAAELFASQSKRGSVSTGTGVDMAPFPNLAEHLYEVLGVICGRYLREGEVLPNPGVLFSGRPPRAEVRAPKRSFEKAPRSRVRGAVRLNGESATPTLAEEILEPGPGRVRGMIVSGANPMGAIPDSDQVFKALNALDLLVVIDPFETETTRLADYVLPPKFMYEHADITFGLEMSNLSVPYAQYTPTLVDPPAQSQLCDEGYVMWALAKRLGRGLNIMGQSMAMDAPPSDDDFLSLIASRSGVSFDEIKQTAQGGKVFDLPPKHVAPAGEKAGRFAVMPEDVADDMQRYRSAEPIATTLGVNSEFGFRLIPRRIREVSNTSCRDFPSAQKRAAYNPLCIHPEDLSELGLVDRQSVTVSSDNGCINAIVKADSTLKRGVVSMTHGYGGMPGQASDYLKHGSSVSPLISLSRDCEPLQAMPRMSAIPVRIDPT